MSKTFRIGDIVTAKVTGVQNYGVFLELDEDTQGLIHISECKHGYMDNVHDFVKVGQEVTAKVIDVDEFSNKFIDSSTRKTRCTRCSATNQEKSQTLCSVYRIFKLSEEVARVDRRSTREICKR